MEGAVEIAGTGSRQGTEKVQDAKAECRSGVQGSGRGCKVQDVRCRSSVQAGMEKVQAVAAGCRAQAALRTPLTALLSPCLQVLLDSPCRAPPAAEEPPLLPIPPQHASPALPPPGPNKGPCQRLRCPWRRGDIAEPLSGGESCDTAGGRPGVTHHSRVQRDITHGIVQMCDITAGRVVAVVTSHPRVWHSVMAPVGGSWRCCDIIRVGVTSPRDLGQPAQVVQHGSAPRGHTGTVTPRNQAQRWDVAMGDSGRDGAP